MGYLYYLIWLSKDFLCWTCQSLPEEDDFCLVWRGVNDTEPNTAVIWQIPNFKEKRLLSLCPGAFILSVIWIYAFLESYLHWLSFLADLDNVNTSVLKALSFFHKPLKVLFGFFLYQHCTLIKIMSYNIAVQKKLGKIIQKQHIFFFHWLWRMLIAVSFSTLIRINVCECISQFILWTVGMVGLAHFSSQKSSPESLQQAVFSCRMYQVILFRWKAACWIWGKKMIWSRFLRVSLAT